MKKFIFLILIVLLLSGCTSTVEKNFTQSENLIQKLQEKGYSVIKKQVGKGTAFPVSTTYYKVDGNTLAIYEFPNEKEAKKESKTISEDGSKIGGRIFEWIDSPHFYQKGEIIVIYIGSDAKLLKDLEEILGKSIINSPILNK
jgi:uncharacterized protein YceK